MRRTAEKLRISGLGSLTMDGWLFALLVGGYAIAVAPRFESTTSVILLLLALGAIASYLKAKTYRTRLLLAYAAIAAIAIAPTILGIYLRHITAPYKFAQDGMIQTEEAVKFLLAGKNPYAENYLDTPLAQWWVPGPGEPVNPALYHFVYLPFLVAFSAPFYAAAQLALQWFDERMIFLPLFVITCLLLPRLARTGQGRLAVLVAVGLNPLFVPFLAEGRNDVFVLFWLVLSIVLLKDRLRALSVLALAFAAATKQTAWFILPFYTLFLYSNVGFEPIEKPNDFGEAARRVVPWLVLFVIVTSVIILPFVLWNPITFIDDVFRYPYGLTEHGFPIQSLGLGGLALAFGWIANNSTLFPFELLQLMFGLPSLLLLLYFQHRHNTLSRVWLSYGFLTLVVGFLSRVFNDSHVGYVVNLLAIGFLSDIES